ncbi:hypothetical protein ACVIGA_000647 [Bradyrhizobium sp. USDA 3240]
MLFGVLDQAEVSDDGSVWLMFGTVSGDWLQGQLAQQAVVPSDEAGRTQFFVAMPLYLLEIQLSANDVLAIGRPGGTRLPPPPGRTKRTLERTLLNLESRWVRIILADGGPPANLYDNLFGAPIPVGVGSIRPPTKEQTRFLDALDPLDKLSDASEEQIETALTSASRVKEIAVYDVGQGAANGLISAHEVVCYFDFGGGVAGHTPTFPTGLRRFCQCNRPPIILSHWDHDHWSSQGRDKRVHAQTWIVPRQASNGKRAPHHLALISAILKRGAILVWPSTLYTKRIGQLEISLCTGSSKNASGLSLTVYPPSTASAKPILMPADAGYNDLRAYLGSGAYDAVVCPHHGGRSNSPSVPTPPSSGSYQRLIYSYGTPNSYGHPLPATFTKHDSAKWIDRRVTPPPASFIVRNTADRTVPPNLGHVGFDWTTSTSLTALACAAGSDLNVQQK